MIFSNPPLIEIVAELHWIPEPSAPTLPEVGKPVAIQFPILSSQVEEAFSRFSNKIAENGFGLSERLIPVGFPTFAYNPVYRFRKPPGQEGNFLYQIGAGLFSANALPPYRDWESFRPIVRQGVEALLNSRLPEQGDFTKLALRYINLFTPEFTGDRTSFSFINDVLGIRLELPAALSQQLANMSDIQEGLQLSMPLKNGLRMALALVEGAAAGKSGIIMTTEVSSSAPIQPQRDRIMDIFETAHGSIRETFVGLTLKLRDTLGPVQ